ncbi:hypothetical protein IE81DRAFT_327127 [Ceraceosorus guamensis]|uniref:Cns1/TTC4 wheel domain-containing protein n=1 Tax=Ceraceosorus guamensis TaxID=1522189 RepID=A0A316VNC1_9BASI|nr:hypothetical protein IE81DRAFT_327127 [Ceraceosorus guamensis]PWN38804.1 hypothetical protein IE81DRAFT_327127 [Ceraceosorus guamensis]
MARLEELPAKVERQAPSSASTSSKPTRVPDGSHNPHLSSVASANAGEQEDHTAGPDPAQRDLKSHMQGFDEMPLFMRQVKGDEQGEDENTALEALKSLAFDGEPDEIAQNFKSQGTDYFKGKRFREAAGFFTQALDANPTDPSLREACLGNRAACNLELENYGAVLRDTSAVLSLNPRNSKAFYRASRALLQLDRTTEAVDCCDHALALGVESEKAGLNALREKIVKRDESRKRRENEKKERGRREKLDKEALLKGFLARGLWIETSSRPPDNPHPAHFDLEAQPSSSLPLVTSNGEANTAYQPADFIRTPIIFPVFLLYPAEERSDFISDYQEDVPLGEYLDRMFPPGGEALPWDSSGEYRTDNLRVYASTKARRLFKIGRGRSLREMIDLTAREEDAQKKMKRDGMILRDGMISLVVLPAGEKESKWVAKFKRERDQSTGGD